MSKKRDFYSTGNRCADCGTPITDRDVFQAEYTYCRSYCCGCCPTKDGFRKESCHKDYIDRGKGLPVGVMESWNNVR